MLPPIEFSSSATHNGSCRSVVRHAVPVFQHPGRAAENRCAETEAPSLPRIQSCESRACLCRHHRGSVVLGNLATMLWSFQSTRRTPSVHTTPPQSPKTPPRHPRRRLRTDISSNPVISPLIAAPSLTTNERLGRTITHRATPLSRNTITPASGPVRTPQQVYETPLQAYETD
jgi:hypothetical protein